MNRPAVDVAAVALGVGGVLAVVFAVIKGDPYGMVTLGGAAALVTVVLGAAASAGGRLGRPVLIVAAGVGYLAAAALQLAQVGRDTNWLGGDGSTIALFLGLGAGLLALASARTPALSATTDPDSEDR